MILIVRPCCTSKSWLWVRFKQVYITVPFSPFIHYFKPHIIACITAVIFSSATDCASKCTVLCFNLADLAGTYTVQLNWKFVTLEWHFRYFRAAYACIETKTGVWIDYFVFLFQATLHTHSCYLALNNQTMSQLDWPPFPYTPPLWGHLLKQTQTTVVMTMPLHTAHPPQWWPFIHIHVVFSGLLPLSSSSSSSSSSIMIRSNYSSCIHTSRQVMPASCPGARARSTTLGSTWPFTFHGARPG